jgi:lauroyl/myristoyl acyltransferase
MDARDLYLLSVFALIRGVGWLSSARLRESIVRGFSAAAYRFSKSKRRQIERRIREALDDDLDNEQVQSIAKGAFGGFWQETFSVARCLGDKTVIESVRVRGIGHLSAALEQGRGVILWESVGFGKRTLAKQILHSRGFPVYQVHAKGHARGFGAVDRPATWTRSRLVHPLFERLESLSVKAVVYLPRSGSLAFTRQLRSLLESNAILCVPGDGGVGQKQIRLHFLGRTRGFATGMVSLARVCGAAILPFFCFEEGCGETRLVIEAPIQVWTGLSRELAVEGCLAQYVHVLESYVKKYPEQYWVWHLD